MQDERDIVFLCQYFYPEYISSATLPFDTALALSQAGYKVSAIVGYPKEYNIDQSIPLNETVNGIEIERLKYFQLSRTNFLGRLINYFSFTATIAINIMKFRKFKSVIVYSNPPILPLIAVISKKLFGTKLIFVSYDVYPEMAIITNSISEKGLITKLMNLVNNLLYASVDRVIALSNEMKNYLVSHRKRISANDVVVIPNWYEDKGDTNITNSKYNDLFKSIVSGENLVVSYFGNLGICQDITTIIDTIRATAYVDNIKYLFAGHGNKMDYLKQVVKEEQLQNVFIFDFLHGQDFQDALTISDCFLVSLEKGLDGLAVPSKTYSYMMAGKPVIAIMDENSDISKDLIRYNAGFSIEVGRNEEIVRALEFLLNNPTDRKLMGDNCRRVYIDKYTKELNTKKYIGVIKELLGEK